jgi:hypothetical protein
MQKENNSSGPQKLSEAGTGNRSNPPAPGGEPEPPAGNQLLGEGAEKYLREVASIEDLPDARDQEEADKIIREENDNTPKEQGNH